MTAATGVADLRRILRERYPLIDLRAPAEFARGAFMQATSLPLLDDAQRAAVGSCYKRNGKRAAIELGETLVSGELRAMRIRAWQTFIRANPNTRLYCWRGGLRSQIAQRWLHDAGIDVPRIDGGYKALRRVCIDSAMEFSRPDRLLVIGGRTGSGKTALLNEFAQSLDLERLANHRGSAFGATFSAQPTPICFENELGVELLHKTPAQSLLVEDESRTIGRLALPEALHGAMQQAPLLVLEISRSERARNICAEYVGGPLASGIAPTALRQRFIDATDRIARRLGGVRHTRVRAAIDDAFATADAAADHHLGWIELLLEWYYDPMYDHQLTAKHSRVVARGDTDAIRRYLRQHLAMQ